MSRIFILICIVLSSTFAYAQYQGDDVYDPFADYSEFEENNQEEADIHFFKNGRFFNAAFLLGGRMFTNSMGTYMDTSFSPGVYLAYFFNLRFALQFSYTFSEHRYNVSGPGFETISGNVSYSSLAFDLKYYFNTQNVTRGLADLNPFAQEKWLLYYRFFNYISEFKLPDFKHRKLKYVPFDKKGFNVWSLILDFIVVIGKDQPDLIEREMDRIRKFTAKYLTSEGDARTKLFLKLLQIIGREYKNTKVCKRKGSYILNKLKQTPVAGFAYAEIEIVPYEHLWELILSRLENNK